MKRFTLTLLSTLFITALWAQIPSNCEVSQALVNAYDRDVKGLVIKRMQELNDPDLSLIEIPQEQQDSILEGMAAILHATSLPERDTVFDLYCVHDVFSNPAVYGFIMGVDTESEIAASWEAGNTFSGNAIIDTLLAEYDFELTNYIASIGAAVFYTDRLLNLFALADSITGSVPEIQYGEPDYLIGGAGRINYQVQTNGDRHYEFRFEWNDCFDGCDNFRSWMFRVTPDCSVEYLGAEEGGFFGVEPLPEPVNCMLTSGVESPVAREDKLRIFPNPTSGIIQFKNTPASGQWILMDATGRQLMEGAFDRPSIDVGNLPKGMYWLRYTNQAGLTGVEPFVKI